jgi:predicted small lipoprotein YifL
MMFKYSAGLVLISALFGCGQKGPLYLPDEPAPIHVEKDKDKQ